LKEDLRYYFHEYQDYVADQTVILRDVETKKGYYFPYTTRFDGNYANRVRAKLRQVKFDFGVLVTLTVDPKRFNNIDEAVKGLKKGWNRVHPQLNRRFGKITYLAILEFGKLNDMPHLHIFIERVRFNAGDEAWLQNLWDKHVAEQIDVTKIRNTQASGYVLKYLQKTFDNKGAAIIDGNAWAYWITTSNFYSVSQDLRERMVSTMEQAYNLIREEMYCYNDVVALTERSLYEYIGTVESSLLGAPRPDFVTNQWLYESGFLYSDVHECWFYAGIGDIN